MFGKQRCHAVHQLYIYEWIVLSGARQFPRKYFQRGMDVHLALTKQEYRLRGDGLLQRIPALRLIAV